MCILRGGDHHACIQWPIVGVVCGDHTHVYTAVRDVQSMPIAAGMDAVFQWLKIAGSELVGVCSSNSKHLCLPDYIVHNVKVEYICYYM